jgi:hypothetical protein
MVTSSTTEDATSSTNANSSNSSANVGSGTSQMRLVMHELSLTWANVIQEQAVQIRVLQTVLLKKEDPSSHKKFSEILSKSTSTNNAGVQHPMLADGKIVELFWTRLSVSLQEVLTEKLKSNFLSVQRMYPSLRRAALTAMDNIEV